MTLQLLFLDVAPDPVSSGMSAVVLILIGVVALMITAATVLGFVFGLRAILRARTSVRAAKPQTNSEFQPSNPNQR